MPESKTAGIETLASQVTAALSELLKTSASPEIIQLQQLLLRRLALQGDVFSSRIPPPRNITEVGGYINLLNQLNETEIRTQSLAAALGVAGPNRMITLDASCQKLHDMVRRNDRPPGSAQASIPVHYRIRNDFVVSLDEALEEIHLCGCYLPIHSATSTLPVMGSNNAKVDMLDYLGRVLNLMPTAALSDPDKDPLALARESDDQNLQLVARVVNLNADKDIESKNWTALKCDAQDCDESTEDRQYLPLTEILNNAGWYQPTLDPPKSLASPGNWARWTNITGLIPGLSKFGDELKERFSSSQIEASLIRDRLDWTWNGEKFTKGPSTKS